MARDEIPRRSFCYKVECCACGQFGSSLLKATPHSRAHEVVQLSSKVVKREGCEVACPLYQSTGAKYTCGESEYSRVMFCCSQHYRQVLAERVAVLEEAHRGFSPQVRERPAEDIHQP